VVAGYGWWYGTYSATAYLLQCTACCEIHNSRLTFPRLPCPRRPSPRRFLPEARGRPCRSTWPEISDKTSRNKISYVLRMRGCIEGCWSWDQVYHRRGDPPKACQIDISQVNKRQSRPAAAFLIFLNAAFAENSLPFDKLFQRPR
jgi:hypothetical protein